MFNFVLLNTRPGAENPKVDFGVEITIPKFLPEGVINLDHHGPNDGVDTPSAIEQAMTCPLPESGAVVATIRADADSVGAMAVLSLRARQIAFREDLVQAISAIDRYGSTIGGFEEVKPLTVAIARKAAAAKVPLPERVAWVAEVLAGRRDSANEEVVALNQEREREHAAAIAASKLTLAANGRLAVVESTHRFATEIGYQHCRLVLAFNPRMPVNFADPSQGTYRKFTFCRYNEFVAVDMRGITSELNALESARSSDGLTWGGQANIIGSPQGRDSTLSIEEVIKIISKYLP